MKQTILALTATLALAVAAPPAASAATGWSTPEFPISDGYQPALATNARGDVALANAGGANLGLQVAVRPAGGTFDAPTSFGVGAIALDARVAINDAGDVAVAWGSNNAVHVAIRRHGEAFGTPLDIATAASVGFDFVRIGIDDAGEVAVAWNAYQAPNNVVKYAIIDTDGTLGPIGTSTLGQPTSLIFGVAMNDQGDAIVAWTRSDGTHTVLQAATRPAGGAFGAQVQQLSDTSQDAGYPTAAIDAAGNAVIAFQQSDGSNIRTRLVAHPAGGLFTLPTDVSPAGVAGTWPSVALADGDVLVTWQTGGSKATARVGSFGAPFSNPTAQYDTTGSMPAVAAAPDGRAMAAWAGNAAGGILTALREPGGNWGNPILAITPVPYSFSNVITTPIAMDDTGDAMLSWTTTTGGKTGFSVLDVTGPELRSLSAPSTATAGSAATFSVAPFDAFSAITTMWDFGDGSPAVDGASVSHTFGAAGNYTVKVTATDATGNATSATRKVAVAAAPIPPSTLPIIKDPQQIQPKPTPKPRCKVPSLKNLSTARAKTKLTSAHCKLGKVTTPKRYKHKKGLVIRSQSRRANTLTTNGAKVNVTLGTKPKPKKKKARGR